MHPPWLFHAAAFPSARGPQCPYPQYAQEDPCTDEEKGARQMRILKDEEFLPFASKLINEARHSVDVSTFKAELTRKPRGKKVALLFDKMIKKAQHGLPVRFLIGKPANFCHVPMTNLLTIRELAQAKVQVRHLKNSRTCHAKLIIVDNRAAILGSHNLSIKSCQYNFECSIYVDDPEIVANLSAFFLKAYDNARKGSHEP